MTNKKQLAETYLKLGKDIGFDNVSLSAIASENNITKATVFSHFPGFDALKEEAVSICLNALSNIDIEIDYRCNDFRTFVQSLTDSFIDSFSVFPLNAYTSMLSQLNYIPRIRQFSKELDMMITARLTVALDFAVQHAWSDFSNTDLVAEILTPAFRKLIEQDISLYNSCIDAFIKIRS